MDWISIITGVGGGGILAKVISLIWPAKKDTADTRRIEAERSKLEAEATEVMIRNLQTVIIRCENEIKRMEATIGELRTDLYKAQKIIRNYAGQDMDDK